MEGYIVTLWGNYVTLLGYVRDEVVAVVDATGVVPLLLAGAAVL